jgi:UPF0755 protein
MRRGFLGLILLAALALAGAAAGRLAWFAYTPAAKGSAQTALVEVQKGHSPAQIARALRDAGAITDERLFRWTGRALRAWPKLKAGEYKVGPGMSPLEILAVLASGVSVARPVTVREGANMYEVAAEIERQGLAPRTRVLERCRDPAFVAAQGLGAAEARTLEGYLFPDTYHFNRTLSAGRCWGRWSAASSRPGRPSSPGARRRWA